MIITGNNNITNNIRYIKIKNNIFSIFISFILYYVFADLKPKNIFITSDDVIKIGDFGIARVLSNTDAHANTSVGTPYYISPEICQKQPYK